jgi:hypothetical protein
VICSLSSNQKSIDYSCRSAMSVLPSWVTIGQLPSAFANCRLEFRCLLNSTDLWIKPQPLYCKSWSNEVTRMRIEYESRQSSINCYRARGHFKLSINKMKVWWVFQWQWQYASCMHSHPIELAWSGLYNLTFAGIVLTIYLHLCIFYHKLNL